VRNRLIGAGLAMLLVYGVGVLGYWLLGRGVWSVEDCAYMVMITITTVGYEEVLPISLVEWGRPFTMVLLVCGMGVSVYFLSSLTAFIIEGDLREALWRRRMSKRLSNLNGHYIVAGAGQTGRHVAGELVRADRDVVVIEQAREHLDRLVGRLQDRVIGILGDATDDIVLREAGIERAAGIVSALEHDQDNLYVALSARQLNPALRIVARGNDERAAQKLQQAGADAVVSPATIGGKRMAHELLRPSVVGFLELIGPQASKARSLCIEEVVLPEGSSLVGRQLAKSNIRKVSNALVLAVFGPSENDHIYNPPPNFVFRAGMTLIVLGERDAVERLHRHVEGAERAKTGSRSRAPWPPLALGRAHHEAACRNATPASRAVRDDRHVRAPEALGGC
jgi:voltage-gated potassium channel